MLGSIDTMSASRYATRQGCMSRTRCLASTTLRKSERQRFRDHQSKTSHSSRVRIKPSSTLAHLRRSTRSFAAEIDISEEIQNWATQRETALQSLIVQIRSHSSAKDKVALLKRVPQVSSFLKEHGEWFSQVTKEYVETDVYLLLCVIALDQSHVFVDYLGQRVVYASPENCRELVRNLRKLETFYNSLGGVLGYQLKSLQLISDKSETDASVEYLMPCFLDLSEDEEQTKQAVCAGIESIPFLAEIYALGGSGDRLGLQCSQSGDLLPSAMLPYCGRSMLHSMIRDLQARESLYFKLTGEACVTPIAIMTSDAKDNDKRIRNMLESQQWFGRGKESFFLFKQPVVPLLDVSNGLWLTNAPGKIVMRPGGHGVIWKLMWDEGVFDWLKSMNKRAAVLRQVSNPLAATDTTLFGLSGVGFSQQKAMGFASCERVVGASEGMNVIQHRCTTVSGEMTHTYGITNIEYTEFERLGLVDVSIDEEGTTSCFPANTNILYVSLDAAKTAVDQSVQQGGYGACLPGLIFNKKKKVSYENELNGKMKECFAGRMECMMQNLADSLADGSAAKLRSEELTLERLSTFMVSNIRRKVTSSAKRKYKPGGSIRQTPEGSFWDLQLNARDVLRHCSFEIPTNVSVEEYLKTGPAFVFLFHPALGPLWSIISQKLHRGLLYHGSELVLEVAEAFVEDLVLEGSLVVVADSVCGSMSATKLKNSSISYSETLFNGNAILEYSNRVGRLHLENVKVKNAGIDWKHESNVYWQHAVHRDELCTIQLHGQSEFIAKDITINGSHSFEVQDGYQLTLIPDSSNKHGFKEQLTSLGNAKPSWQWRYELIGNDVVLTKHK